jgi:hypothetical protein
MDEPATSIRSGSDSARSRSSRANDSAFVLDIAGLPVLMRGADADHFEAIRAAFGTAAVSAAAPEAEFSYGPGRLAMPSRAPDAHQPDLDVWNDGDILQLSSDAHGVQAMVSPTSAQIVATASPHERALRRIFQTVITHVLAYHGTFVIHAASMQRGDRGLVALGDTGKGKSTIALAAFQDGWRVMGDDLVAMWLVDDVAMIRGLPKPMALPNDVGGRESSALRNAATLDWDQRGRLHVPVELLELAPVPLAAIVVVEHGDATRSTFEPSTADRTTSRLMSSYTSVGNAPLMRQFFPVAIRAARVASGILHHGTDPATRVIDAQAILAEVAARW